MLKFNVPKTALLVMDFQNDLVDPKGKYSSHGAAAQVQEAHALENTNKAIKAARTKELQVVHVSVAFRKGYPDLNSSAPLFAGVVQAGAMIEGTWGAEFHPAVEPSDGDLIVVKRGVSALTGTDLDPILRNRGIDTLVLAGFATNFVVEGTAFEAIDRGYAVVILKDCCASFTAEMHNFAVENLLPHLATMATVEEFVGAL